MKVNNKRLLNLLQELKEDVTEVHASSSINIGCIDGVIFRLEALDIREAIEEDFADILEENECVTEEK